MGLINEQCDSCGEKVGFLFPVAVIDELPSGGTKMVVKYYCVDCFEEYIDIAKEDKGEDAEGMKDIEEEEDRDFNNLIKEYKIRITYCGLERTYYCNTCKFKLICDLTQ